MADGKEIDQWAFALNKSTGPPASPKRVPKDSKKKPPNQMEKQSSFMGGKRRLGKKKFDKDHKPLTKCNSAASLGGMEEANNQPGGNSTLPLRASVMGYENQSLSDNPGAGERVPPGRAEEEEQASPNTPTISHRSAAPPAPAPPVPTPSPLPGDRGPPPPFSASPAPAPAPAPLPGQDPRGPPPPFSVSPSPAPARAPLPPGSNKPALPPPAIGDGHGIRPPLPGGGAPSPRLPPHSSFAASPKPAPAPLPPPSAGAPPPAALPPAALPPPIAPPTPPTPGLPPREIDDAEEEKAPEPQAEKTPEEKEKEEKNRRLRKLCLAEILHTEQEYVKDLDILINVFFFPANISKAQLGITDIDLNGLFSNVQTLKPLHERFCESLSTKFNESEETGEDPCIGDVFVELSSFFKMYMQYCANYPLAVKHYERLLKENKKFAAFMKKCEGDSDCKGLLFGSWAIKPVQRLCKYPLLLRELKAQSPEGHPDHDSIETAKAKIDEVVDVVNEGKRTAERQMKIIEIQELMDNIQMDLVTPSRRFVREGHTELRAKITGKGEKRHLFLFNDLVLVAKAKDKGRFECLKPMHWQDCRFIVISEQGKVKHGFEIAHEGERLIFSCESKKAQDEWVADFKMMTKEMKLKKLEEAKKEKEKQEKLKAQQQGQ
mmetsp:Transcript_23345/g.36419  ORF Transcript_23345/g.36419 Transcript_23345/m.36419 type:complete len:660 (-) Transcript_23345:242-2221(-)|eukprot:CAMPEP_0201525210 /NCGR_PEP_ID=MMETSP0161_2-20130828/27241_1 /ASSEMBLY_ACC=CAM_ASM_000251 /TAXON_ID=180227 /ORGANISM="Neoparamoeba aestuarina, Strain SoJaBio B1-5/56/2" /LENGTH=659 /DNA_ID=CAMNT_0047925035 /DNA_START=102 /DNA_END=2081 /DNA_ORIENTATION=-